MESIREEFKHLEIKLEDIKLATNDFDKTKIIGYGGFGDVFEGEMSHSKGRSMVAIKRLVRRHGQGDPEFLKEISTLSRYSHKNLITLMGFCNHGDEKILVYEHAARGSLDLHLASPALTWTRRIKICLDAAKGLGYLHDPRETHQRVLHRDVKSSNILIDAGWNAKISDMGLSKIGPANQLHTALYTDIAGTPGYCDPHYFKTYTLTKESDVYSFGVVLFEVLCGKLCYKKTKSGLEILVPKWKQSYQEKKLDTIIFQGSGQPINPTALDTFSRIAFQCLQKSRERPTMSRVVEQLEMALELQGPGDLNLQDDEIIPLTNRFKVDLEKLPTAFTTKKDYGREEREAQWALAQRTLHGLQAPETSNIFNEKTSYRELSEIAEQAKRRAEVARLREVLTLKGHVESVVKLKGLDIDTIQQNYTA